MKAFDLQASKKPTNLTINSDLLSKARELNMNFLPHLKMSMPSNYKLNNENSGFMKTQKPFKHTMISLTMKVLLVRVLGVSNELI